MKTVPLICIANQWTAFYMTGASVMRELSSLGIWWSWIVFVVWLTEERYLALFPAEALSEILTIAILRHTASRVWNCAEPEFRRSGMKLCSSDNHCTAAPHTAHEKCPNTEFLLDCFFPYLVQIRTRRNSVFEHSTQWQSLVYYRFHEINFMK